MSTSNHILSDMVDIIRIRIRIRPKIWKQIWYQWYSFLSDPFSSLAVRTQEPRLQRCTHCVWLGSARIGLRREVCPPLPSQLRAVTRPLDSDFLILRASPLLSTVYQQTPMEKTRSGVHKCCLCGHISVFTYTYGMYQPAAITYKQTNT